MCNFCLELESQARIEVGKEWREFRGCKNLSEATENRLVRAKLAEWAIELLALLDKGRQDGPA